MASIITIELRGLRFHAYHGLFEEEKVAGNEFQVDLFVNYEPSEKVINDIAGTINYADIFQLVSRQMKKRRDLLETVAMDIAENIKENYSLVKSIDITITKINPPISGFTGSVGVRFNKDF
ncbi:MAG TPA: dihydroneopterin aldolase [Chitinophagaceae bacterium]|nr:dihydroneopterin aldolase [Chitinophagaceae bacterium]